MKKVFAVLALSLLTVQSAFANGMSEYRGGHRGGNGGAIAGAVVGGLIVGGVLGALAAQAASEAEPNHVVCYARNGRGDTFRAFGIGPSLVQRRALDNCLSQSFSCRPVGCQVGY